MRTEDDLRLSRAVTTLLQKRGLRTQGDFSKHTHQENLQWLQDHRNAIDDAAIQINAQQRQKTNIQMLRMSLERKIKNDAHRKGYNSTLIESHEDKG